MAYALISHVTVPGANNGTTSASIDTTGASILIFAIARHGFTADPAVSDSKGNSWSFGTEYSGFIGTVRIFYAINPTVGTGHTFTLNGGNTFTSGCIAAFSGADTSSPFDVENGNGISFGSPQSTIQPGSITPSQANSLVISALGTAPNGSPSGYTIDSSFTITDTVDALDNQASGSGLAYLIETSATAQNPTWSISNTGSAFGTAATIASFKPAAAFQTFNDSITETLSATDTDTGVGVLPVSITEAGSATESISGLVIFVDSNTETTTASETTVGSAVYPTATTEALTATDVPTSTVPFPVSISETVAASENVDNLLIARPSITEAATAIEIQTGSVSFVVSITETVNATVVFSIGNVFEETVDEIINADEFLLAPHVLPPVLYYPPPTIDAINLIRVDRGQFSVETKDRTKINLIKARYARQKRGLA